MQDWLSSIWKVRRQPRRCPSVRTPDVLAFDTGFSRLYVSAESGIISILDVHGRTLEKVGEGLSAANAHSVAVDSRTHRVYFPLQNVSGQPLLRITLPTDKQL